MCGDSSVEGLQKRRRDVGERVHPVADPVLAGSEHDERNGVARVPALVHRLDVAVVRRHHERDAGRLRATHERGKKPVVHAQHRARARVVHGVPGDVGLEELVEGEVVEERKTEQMLRRTLRRDDRDVRVAVLDRLPRQVLHERPILHQVLGDGNRLGGRERHHGRHGLEAAGADLLGRIDKIRVREPDALIAPPQLHEEVVVLDNLAKLHPREPLAVLPDRSRAIHSSEHRRLPRRGLWQPLDPQAGVNWLGMLLYKTTKRRTDLHIKRIIRRWLSQAHTINKKINDFQACESISHLV